MFGFITRFISRHGDRTDARSAPTLTATPRATAPIRNAPRPSKNFFGGNGMRRKLASVLNGGSPTELKLGHEKITQQEAHDIALAMAESLGKTTFEKMTRNELRKLKDPNASKYLSKDMSNIYNTARKTSKKQGADALHTIVHNNQEKLLEEIPLEHVKKLFEHPENLCKEVLEEKCKQILAWQKAGVISNAASQRSGETLKFQLPPIEVGEIKQTSLEKMLGNVQKDRLNMIQELFFLHEANPSEADDLRKGLLLSAISTSGENEKSLIRLIKGAAENELADQLKKNNAFGAELDPTEDTPQILNDLSAQFVSEKNRIESHLNELKSVSTTLTAECDNLLEVYSSETKGVGAARHTDHVQGVQPENNHPNLVIQDDDEDHLVLNRRT